MTTRFTDLLTSEAALRDLLGEPSDLVVRKQLGALDKYCCAYIERSPFLAISTVDAGGRHDVSPRGDAPGFVQVLDNNTLLIPERPGNRRADTLRNILQTGGVGLIFLVPGVEETLRVNGRACLVRDAALLDRCIAHGKRPLLAIGVTVDECFLHCAKAFKRSALWSPATWPERSALPSLCQMIFDQVRPPDVTLNELETTIEEGYRTRLY